MKYTISIQAIVAVDKDNNFSICAARQAALVAHKKAHAKYHNYAGLLDYVVYDWHYGNTVGKCDGWDKVLDKVDAWYQSHRHLFEK